MDSFKTSGRGLAILNYRTLRIKKLSAVNITICDIQIPFFEFESELSETERR